MQLLKTTVTLNWNDVQILSVDFPILNHERWNWRTQKEGSDSSSKINVVEE